MGISVNKKRIALLMSIVSVQGRLFALAVDLATILALPISTNAQQRCDHSPEQSLPSHQSLHVTLPVTVLCPPYQQQLHYQQHDNSQSNQCQPVHCLASTLRCKIWSCSLQIWQHYSPLVLLLISSRSPNLLLEGPRVPVQMSHAGCQSLNPVTASWAGQRNVLELRHSHSRQCNKADWHSSP